MALIYPRLYLTVRKSIRTEDGDVVSYAVVRIRNREQAVAKDDPCPDGRSRPKWTRSKVGRAAPSCPSHRCLGDGLRHPHQTQV